MIQICSVLSAIAILAAFAGGQFRWMSPTGLIYLVLNSLGAAVLTVVAWIEQQWGFLLLEGVWTAVSLFALARLLSGRTPDAA